MQLLGAHYVASLEIRSLTFETVSLVLPQGFEIERDGTDRSPACNVMAELKLFLRQNFAACRFSFANRNCNKVAHTLVSYVSSLNMYDDMQAEHVIPLLSDIVARDAGSD